MAGGIELGGIIAMLGQKVVPVILLVLLAGVVLGFFLLAKKGFLKLPFLTKYPITAVIVRNRGGTKITELDKARLVQTDKGTYAYELKREAVNVPAPKFSHMLPVNAMVLYEKERGQFNPVILTEKETTDGQSVAVDMVDPLAFEHYANLVGDLHARHDKPGFWQTWGGLLTAATLILLSMIFIYGVLQSLGPLTQSIAELAQAVASVSSKVGPTVVTPPA